MPSETLSTSARKEGGVLSRTPSNVASSDIAVTEVEAPRLVRIAELLGRLDSYSDLRAACLLGLTDDVTPHPVAALAAEGLKLSAGATTRQLFQFAAPKLGKMHIDRELRDEVWPRLRELGIVQRSYVLTAKEARREGKLVDYGVHRRAKSPNNGYALTGEARRLLVETLETDWAQELDEFVHSTDDRRRRVLQHEATTAAATAPGDHSKLMQAAVAALRAARLPDYKLVFIDEADETRIKDEWKEKLEPRGLLPDLDSLWPDAILVRDADRSLWFIDAVTTDGEIDETRRAELQEWAAARGYTVSGYTTAYETWRRTSTRQGKMKNLAVGTNLWIAEDGGKLFTVDSLADGE
jgi:hypothetical protein